MLSEIARMITIMAGQAPPRIRLPIAPLMPLAMLMEGWARVSGHEPLMTRDTLRMARKLMFFSSAKAMRELGYAPRPAELAFRDALADFTARELLPRRREGLVS